MIVAVMTTKSLALSILMVVNLCPLVAEDAPLHWIPLPSPQVQMEGLAWYSENGGELFRLPAKLKDSYRQPIWELAKDPSGGRIRFRTNSSLLAIRLEYPGPPNGTNMHAFGQTGVDLYADGVYRGTAIADHLDPLLEVGRINIASGNALASRDGCQEPEQSTPLGAGADKPVPHGHAGAGIGNKGGRPDSGQG